MPLHAQAWQQAGRAFGLRVSRRLIYAWEGETGTVTAATLLKQHSRRPSRKAIRRLLDEKEHRFQQLAHRRKLQLLLVRTVRRLRRRKVPLALVTGTSLREVRRALPAEIRRLFQVIITGDQVRHGKPHPEPYRLAFRRLRVPPASAVVVENAPYGIQSARAAGAGAILALASSLPKRYLRGADQVVASVPALCRVVERLAAAD